MLKPKIRLIKSDQGWNKIKKEFKEQDSVAAIGFFEEDIYSDGKPIAYISLIQEFGTADGRIPARPHHREWFDSKINIMKNLIIKEMNAIHEGKISFDDMLATLGEYGKNELKNVIIKKSTPPNAPATVRKKGFNDPLIETGKMRDSAKYKIIKGKGVNSIK